MTKPHDYGEPIYDKPTNLFDNPRQRKEFFVGLVVVVAAVIFIGFLVLRGV